MFTLSRRGFLAGTSALSLTAFLPQRLLGEVLSEPGPFRFFNDHQAKVVREATARLIPGPFDDPLEAGHPGAREANSVRYIDILLSALSFMVPKVHAGGPWSDRAGGQENFMARFVPLSPLQRQVWKKRIRALQRAYVTGITSLDRLAGGDFTAVAPEVRDAILAYPEASAFRDLLFRHAIEAMYAVPEYGGNEDLVGWGDIKFPGDTQPRGYTPEEVSGFDGADQVDLPTEILEALAAMFGAT